MRLLGTLTKGDRESAANRYVIGNDAKCCYIRNLAFVRVTIPVSHLIFSFPLKYRIYFTQLYSFVSVLVTIQIVIAWAGIVTIDYFELLLLLFVWGQKYLTALKFDRTFVH